MCVLFALLECGQEEGRAGDSESDDKGDPSDKKEEKLEESESGMLSS